MKNLIKKKNSKGYITTKELISIHLNLDLEYHLSIYRSFAATMTQLKQQSFFQKIKMNI